MRCTNRSLGMMLAVGACLLATSSAFAGLTSLPAGSSGVAVSQTDTFATDVGAGYTVLDAYSATFGTGGTPAFSVTLYVDAIRTSGGTIDLLYQVTNNSTASTVDSMSLSDFSSVTGVAVAGLSDATAPAGTNFVPPTGTPNPPNIASRSGTPGATISFTFSSSPLGDIGPGQTSGLTLIVTGSTSYNLSGAATVSSSQGGGGSGGFNYVPEVIAASVPEPGSLVLSCLALISGAGVYGVRRLRRK
jgi:hypothetical protein